MDTNINVVIVEKTKSLRNLCIKLFNEDDLYKKCGFKTSNNFDKHGEWSVKDSTGKACIVSLYGKKTGKAGTENMYDFPPPNDTTLFFGNCLLTCHVHDKKESSEPILKNLDVELWEKIYEKLFGGFEDLSASAEQDELEVDELENVPSHMKTKEGGYLKDGFVVDDNEEESQDAIDNESVEYEDEEESIEYESEEDGSELTEDSFVLDVELK
tara:strand:+ start:6523 stop:7161 length:639 start_codon:yes stop_codon:yes gene_type:complete